MARNKSAVQSSTALSLGASYAVDGNTDGGLYLGGGHIDTCTHTERNDQHPWWTVDLGKTYEIHSIVLFNRRGTVGKLIKIYIQKHTIKREHLSYILKKHSQVMIILSLYPGI